METQLERMLREALELTLDERAELARLLLASLDGDADGGELQALQAQRPCDANENQAHTEWMRNKVAESLANPSPNMTHEHVMADLQTIIDAKRKRHAAKAAS